MPEAAQSDRERHATEDSEHLAEIARLNVIISVQAEIIVARLNLQDLMEFVAARAESMTAADGAVVEMLEGDEMVYHVATGIAAGSVGIRIKASSSLSGLCVAGAKVLCCEDSESDTRVDRAACQMVGLRSMIVVPLLDGDQCVGVVKVLAASPNHFNAGDVRLLQLMASLIGSAMGRAGEQRTRERLMVELERANERLAALARTDDLTALSNRRHFDDSLRTAYAQETRRKGALSLILIDVDHFKEFNDQYGHMAGDDVLRTVAATLRKHVRAHEDVARYGGEEFAVVLPGTDAVEAVALSQRLRNAIKNVPWPLREITISLGVATMDNECDDPKTLIYEADTAMYRSKHTGRDRVTHYRDT